MAHNNEKKIERAVRQALFQVTEECARAARMRLINAGKDQSATPDPHAEERCQRVGAKRRPMINSATRLEA